MKLYTNKLCPYAQRVHIALLERNLHPIITFEEVNLESPPASLLASNPLGAVPTLEFSLADGIYESMQIMAYLDSLPAEGPKLFGENPRQSIKTALLSQKILDLVLQPLLEILYSKGNVNKRNTAIAKLPSAFDLLDNTLAKFHDGQNSANFFGGDHLNALDCALAPFLWRYAKLCQRYPNLPSPTKNSLADTYVHALLNRSSVICTSPTDSELDMLFKRFFSPDQGLQNIIDASRDVFDFPANELHLLNAFISEQPTAKAMSNVKFATNQGDYWQLQSTAQGPHLAAEFYINPPQLLPKAIELLIDLQESVDHHTHFVIEDYHKLSVQLCTHEPKWGISRKDFAFAKELSLKLLTLS